MPLFQCPATIQSIRTLVDGGNKLEIITRDINPEEMTILFGLKGSEGYFLFKESLIKKEEVDILPDIKDEFTKISPSQRQRNIIYRLWEKTDRKKSSNDYYLEKMETINQWLKEKLN